MKLLMLIPYPDIRGPINKFMSHLIRGLRFYTCIVHTAYWGRHTEKKETVLKKFFDRIADILLIRKELRDNGFEIVVINTSHDWKTLIRDIALLKISSQFCQKILLQFHGSSPEKLHGKGNIIFKLFSKWMMSLCDGAMVLSSEEQFQWQKFCPKKKFIVVSNPFVPEMIEEKQLFELPWNIQPETKVLLFVGRLIQEKGIFDMLEALLLIKSSLPVHLLVVGDGKKAKAIQRHLAVHRLEKYVTLTGYIEGAYLQSAYSRADIFVLPTYWAEGFPTVIAEAMNAGLPIITTGIRGVLDHLREGTHALYVPPRNPQVLADTIKKLLSDHSLQDKMARANRKKVKNFLPKLVAKDYLNKLEKIC